MEITSQISNFTLKDDATVKDALSKINENNRRLVFLVNSDGLLSGLITDGDFRDWITDHPDTNLSYRRFLSPTGLTSRLQEYAKFKSVIFQWDKVSRC